MNTDFLKNYCICYNLKKSLFSIEYMNIQFIFKLKIDMEFTLLEFYLIQALIDVNIRQKCSLKK